MKKLINIAFYTSFSFIPLSFLFKILSWPGDTLLLLGLLSSTLYFTAKSINGFIKKDNVQISILYLSTGLMSITLFLRYFHWSFWDIPGFIIFPLFVIFSSLSFYKNETRKLLNGKTISTIVLFAIMSVPLFLTFDNSPRRYIPDEWLPQAINNTDYRNENWAWFVKKGEKKGQWLPVGEVNSVKSGKYTLFFPNGEIYEKGTILNEKNVDTVFTYDINEKLIKYKIMLEDTSFDYIVNNGDYTSYHWKTGKILDKGTSNNHILGGNWTRYYESGKIEFKDTIIGNQKIKTKYFESGKTESIVPFINDKRDGVSQFWHDNGQLKEFSNWKNDKKIGIVTFYFKNGQIHEKKNWVDGQKNGFDSLWFENGQLNQVSNNKDGLTNGYCEIWYQNGNYKFKGNFTGKLKQGECKRYSENGVIQTIVVYKNDVPNGLAKIYNDKGDLIEIANYKDGLPNGKVETYKKGKLTQTDIYQDGELIKTQ